MSDASGAPPFLPLSVPVISGNEKLYVADALDTGWLSGAGPYVGRFEQAVCDLTGARFAVATNTGTAALHVALLLAGVRPGDAVVVPTVTFIASANTVRYCGAEPVLVGCDDGLGIDVEALAELLEDGWDESTRVVRDPSGRTIRAIMPVHVFGDPCDMEGVLGLAERFGIPVVEDATESLGSSYTREPLAGRHTGTLGLIGTFSFNGNKIISTGGGGMLVTDDEDLARRARYLIGQAKDDAIRYVHGAVGFNYALTNVAAAIGLAQMERLPAYIETKRANRARYAHALAGVPGITFVAAPEDTAPNCWFYSILVDEDAFGMDREGLMQRLSRMGIQTRPLWLPIHLQEPYAGCPVVAPERAVWYWSRLLNLPCSSDLTADDVDRVVDAIRSLSRS